MSTTRRAAVGLTAAALAAVSLTAACSSGSGGKAGGAVTVHATPTSNGEAAKTGSQVLADAKKAFIAVPVARMVAIETPPTTKQTFHIDLHAQANGGRGTITGSFGTVQLISIGSRTYLKGNLSGYLGSILPTKVQFASGRWYYNDDDPGSSEGLKGIADGFAATDSGVTVEKAVSAGTLDGHQVVVIRESDGSRMYVAATGAPLPLKVVGGSGAAESGLGSVGQATFSYGGNPVKLQAPIGAIVMPTS